MTAIAIGVTAIAIAIRLPRIDISAPALEKGRGFILAKGGKRFFIVNSIRLPL